LLEEVLSPFYVVQVLAVILWYMDEYELYASFIVMTSLISLYLSLKQTMQNQRSLAEMAL